MDKNRRWQWNFIPLCVFVNVKRNVFRVVTGKVFSLLSLLLFKWLHISLPAFTFILPCGEVPFNRFKEKRAEALALLFFFFSSFVIQLNPHDIRLSLEIAPNPSWYLVMDDVFMFYAASLAICSKDFFLISTQINLVGRMLRKKS